MLKGGPQHEKIGLLILITFVPTPIVTSLLIGIQVAMVIMVVAVGQRGVEAVEGVDSEEVPLMEMVLEEVALEEGKISF